jgi:hypothetical protein
MHYSRKGSTLLGDIGTSPITPSNKAIYFYQILEQFQSKALRVIVDAAWYVPNTVIQRDLQIPTVTVEIRRYSSQ